MMLFELLRSYAIWLLVSVSVCIAGICVTLVLDPSQARMFLVSYVYYWDGLLVAMSGFGALHFAMTTHKQQFHYLIFEIFNVTGDLKFAVIAELEKLYSFWNKQFIAIPILIVGMMVLYVCGYPMTGFPKYFLWLSSSFMFYAGGLMLAYGVFSLHIFHFLEKNIEAVGLQDDVNIIELENFNLYLSTLFLAATLALYFAFRGTLTANFTFTPPNQFIEHTVNLFVAPGGNYSSVRSLLLYPIVIFLPLALFSGFYMKLVLRKIYLASIKRKITEIDALAKPIIEDADSKNPAIAIIEVRKTVMELKEKIIQNNKVLPLVTLNDSPSIVLMLVVVLQFIWINDRYVKGFFEGFVGTIN
jgi:hypothetical protein